MQFTVYRNGDERSAARAPYLLDIQSELLGAAQTCVVVPLIASDRAGVPVTRLMPQFEIEGRPLVMDTLQLAGVPRRILGTPVAELSHERTQILAALDMLISGI